MSGNSLLQSDPVTFEVVRNSLYAICEEMKSVLIRTSFSPLLSLSADLSCAILDLDGGVAAQGNDIPVHLGAMPFTGRAVLDAFAPASWREGDSVLLNDPYLGGTHLPDMSLVSPAFCAGKLTAFVATRVHWPDVGGIAAGSSSICDEIIKEGLRIPPVKIIDCGKVREDLLQLILANVRIPKDRLGDFRAQQAANLRGVSRLAEVAGTYGQSLLSAVLEDSQAYSHLKVRKRLENLDDCDVNWSESLDGDGYEPEGSGRLKIVARVIKQGCNFTVDFTGSSPAARGPVNAPLPVTASAVYYTLLGFVGGGIPPNSGAYSVATVIAPEGSIVNARYPSPVVAANTETSNRIVDILLGALGQAYPTRVPAGSYGSACVYTLGGFDTARKRSFVHYETLGGGMGAREGHHGLNGIRVHMGNTMNLPMEALEASMPLRFVEYRIARETVGAGRWQGGGGCSKVIEILEDGMTLSVLGERTVSAAHGINGGDSGGCAQFSIVEATGVRRVLSSKSGPHSINSGDRIELRTAGGGGWGKQPA